MTEPIEPAETIDVEDVPEPEKPEDGYVDPADTYREGVDR